MIVLSILMQSSKLNVMCVTYFSSCRLTAFLMPPQPRCTQYGDYCGPVLIDGAGWVTVIKQEPEICQRARNNSPPPPAPQVVSNDQRRKAWNNRGKAGSGYSKPASPVGLCGQSFGLG